MGDAAFRTERLAMRTWREGDDDRVAAIQTPRFLRWLQDEDMPLRRAGSITARMQKMAADHGFCFWVIERRSDGAFLGYAGLKLVDANGTDLTGAFEIGWGLGEAFHGNGYATEAGAAALDRAFTVHGAPFVVAFTAAGNMPSRRVMERIGMTRRPELDFHDSAFSPALNPNIVHMIDRAEWAGR